MNVSRVDRNKIAEYYNGRVAAGASRRDQAELSASPDSISISGSNSDSKTNEIKLPVANPATPQTAQKPPATDSASSSTPAGASDTEPTDTENSREWTLLFYSAGDNDLEKYIVQDVIDLESNSHLNNANFVVQLDRGQKPSELSGGWAGCRRFKLQKNDEPNKADSPVLEDLGQVNMSDPKTLQEFIEWGINKFPAKNYMLIISDHGAGWQGAVEDNSHKGWMPLPDIGKALMAAQKSTGVKLDVVGFDACLMAQLEVAHELKDTAKYLLASENNEAGSGWPYTCREKGYIPGFATHNGGHTIPQIDQAGIDAPIYLCPFNKTGLHVHPSLEETLEALSNTDKVVIGMKTLACGDLAPTEGFPFAFPYVDAVAVGMVSEQEIDENVKIFEENHELIGTRRKKNA